VKAALLISGADRRKYGKLKDELANNYLLGTDQYPDTFEKALRILGNNQTTTNSLPYRLSPNDTGVAFLSNEGGEMDVEQDEEGKDVAMTRVKTRGAAQPETM